MPSRSPALLIAALAPASLLAVDPAGWYPFGPVKWLAVSVLVPAGAALVLARRPLRVAVVPTAAALALVGWLALAAALGRDPLYAWTGTPERHLGVLTWALCTLALVVGQSLEDGDRRTVVAGLVVAGVGVGAVAVAEALGWEPSELDVADRLSGTLGSPAYLGAAAALLLPVLVGVAADAAWGRRWRVASGLGAGGLVVAALGSGARAAWVGLAAAGVVAAWAQRDVLVGRRRAALMELDECPPAWRRAAPWALAASGALVLGIAVVAGPVGARAADLLDADAPGGRGRVDEWRVAGRVVAAHPVVGVGPEGYRIAFVDGVDEAYQRRHGRDPQPDRAHSTPLDVALAGGLPALAAWLVLAAAAGRAAYAALCGGRPWVAGAGAGLVAYGVGGLFLFPLAELAPVAWLLAGLVLGATSTVHTGAPAPAKANAPWGVPAHRWGA